MFECVLEGIYANRRWNLKEGKGKLGGRQRPTEGEEEKIDETRRSIGLGTGTTDGWALTSSRVEYSKR